MIQFDLCGKTFRMTADKYQWILSEFQPGTKGKAPRDPWKNVAHYASLPQMADKLARMGADAREMADVGPLLGELGLLREALSASQRALEAQGIGPTEP